MKRFLLAAWGMEPADQTVWRREGFDLMQGNAVEMGDAIAYDVLWLCETAMESNQQEFLKSFSPKLIFLQGKAVSLQPDRWQWYLKQQTVVAGVEWVLGSKLDVPLPPEVAALLANRQTTELAAVVYRILLEDVFRETADWCGHMSSVVGRM